MPQMFVKTQLAILLLILTGCAVPMRSTKAPAHVYEILVSGEVRSPNGFPSSRVNSVYSAIVEAGGFTPRARRDRVFIFKNGGRILVVDATRIMKDQKLDLPVSSGDEVHVPKRIWLW